MGGLQQAPEQVVRNRIGQELVAHVAAAVDRPVDGGTFGIGEWPGLGHGRLLHDGSAGRRSASCGQCTSIRRASYGWMHDFLKTLDER